MISHDETSDLLVLAVEMPILVLQAGSEAVQEGIDDGARE